MAIPRPIPIPDRSEERTEEIVISAPLGGTYYVRANRVTYNYFSDKPPEVVSQRTITRDLPALMSDADAASIMTKLPGLIDRWATEDDAAVLPA